MAFGKATDTKRIKNAVLEDALWRTYIKSEESTSQSWKSQWKWILDEYNNLHDKLQELSEGSTFLSGVKGIAKEEDKRSILPVPPTTNHEYGWISNLPDFKLENFGPDVSVASNTLPPLYRLFHD